MLPHSCNPDRTCFIDVAVRRAGTPRGTTPLARRYPGSGGSARPSVLTRGREFVTFRRMMAQMLAGPPLSAADCEAALRERIAHRETHFLDRMQRAVYENPRSPYRPLLRDAGITLDEVRQSVHGHGVDATLGLLRDAGIYLTFDEYKGRQALTRGGRSYALDPDGLLADPDTPVVHLRTGGSTGPAVRVPYHPGFLRESAVNVGTLFYRSVPTGAVGALWYPLQSSLVSLLIRLMLGAPPAAWFTPLREPMRDSWPVRLLLRTVVRQARRRGIALPAPVHVPAHEAHTIAAWIVGQRRHAPACFVVTTPSGAVRICDAARRGGLDISGTRFFVDSEPLTDAKQAEIVAAGGLSFPDYCADDTGSLALPCESPAVADDMHVCLDRVAIVPRRRLHPGTDTAVDAFLVTTLLPTSPRFLLNVELDDYGHLDQRACGCGLAQLGLTQHVSHIRSFAKLTAEGATVPWAELVWVVERRLPQRFGGASTHYQLVEEDADHRTRLTLVVSPEVGPLDDGEVIREFLRAVGEGDRGLRHFAQRWEKSSALRVVRAEPTLTARGKLMPVRVLRGGRAASPLS